MLLLCHHMSHIAYNVDMQGYISFLYGKIISCWKFALRALASLDSFDSFFSFLSWPWWQNTRSADRVLIALEIDFDHWAPHTPALWLTVHLSWTNCGKCRCHSLWAGKLQSKTNIRNTKSCWICWLLVRWDVEIFLKKQESKRFLQKKCKHQASWAKNCYFSCLVHYWQTKERYFQ